MDDAATKQDALTLAEFPGENISKFANVAQHLMKIIEGGYTLPYQLGSQFFNKVCGNQILYFNRTLYNLFDNVLKME